MHVLFVEKIGGKPWNQGTKLIEPFTMEKGESRKVFVELDYASRPEMARDFSVVAWGHNGKILGRIQLTHNDGLESTSFPDMPLDLAFDEI